MQQHIFCNVITSSSTLMTNYATDDKLLNHTFSSKGPPFENKKEHLIMHTLVLVRLKIQHFSLLKLNLYSDQFNQINWIQSSWYRKSYELCLNFHPFYSTTANTSYKLVDIWNSIAMIESPREPKQSTIRSTHATSY